MGTIVKCLIIIIVAILFLFANAVGLPFMRAMPLIDFNLWISFISCIAASANAWLVYKTLKIQKQDRFEVTLFNLLDNHRKLLRSTKFIMKLKNVNMDDATEKISDNNMFEFALREFSLIKEIFHEKEYPHISEEMVQDEMERIGQLQDTYTKENIEEASKCMNSLSHIFSLSQRCDIYGITNEDCPKAYENENDLNEIVYGYFIKKWKNNYAPYLRSLVLIFNHIGNSSFSQKDKVRYRNYIIHQMPNAEIIFIKRHYSYYANLFNDNRFCEALNAVSNKKSFVKTV
jgi:hypothetical protein